VQIFIYWGAHNTDGIAGAVASALPIWMHEEQSSHQIKHLLFVAIRGSSIKTQLSKYLNL
jgi:hypothetical protein